ncbi:MAG: MBL fold metallo-hydrolase [bacterium]|jgi:glyoxylase-like metal-dependent hydrolase (beta-lactamase superfamily II)
MSAGVCDYGEGISAVDAFYDGRADQTAAHILIENGRAAVIDTATAHAAPRILAALAARGVSPAQVDYVVLTHVHLDHAGGAGTLMAQCPNARLSVHPRGARHMIDPSRLMAATVDIYGVEATARVYGKVEPVPAERVIETAEGASLSLAGRVLEFFDAPGHARHHVVVRDTRTGHLFAGDSFGLSYRALDRNGHPSVFPTTSPSQFDPDALHATLGRMLALAPEMVYVAHFGQVREIPRLGADLHRLIDAHVALAEGCRDAGQDRHQRLKAGIAELVQTEALRQGWTLDTDALMQLFAIDIELNAQGLAAWLDAARR